MWLILPHTIAGSGLMPNEDNVDDNNDGAGSLICYFASKFIIYMNGRTLSLSLS